jgi:hypothetical protein
MDTDFAGISPETRRTATWNLLRYAGNHTEDPVLREMCREVASGRLSLERACSSGAYSEALMTRLRPVVDRWSRMTESERENALAAAPEAQRKLVDDCLALDTTPAPESAEEEPGEESIMRPVRRPRPRW